MNLQTRDEIGLVPPDRAIGDISPANTAGHWNGPSIWIARWGAILDHSVCLSLWRGIQRYHMQANNWADIAYGAGACPHGYVLEGRGVGKRTAANGTNHANTVASAVCALVGEGDPVTPEMIGAMLDAWQWLSGGERSGHWDWYVTACPGDEIYNAYLAGQVGPTPEPEPEPEPQAPTAPPFPLPDGWYFGPKEGPRESVSGYYSHRSDLAQWQQRMRDRGWRIGVDGLYGNETAGVARAFQAEKGLRVDGLIGINTWRAAWTTPVT